MYKAWLLLVAIPGRCSPFDADDLCNGLQDNLCTINASKSLPSFNVTYNGKILVTNGAKLVSGSWFVVAATGDVVVEKGSSLSAQGDLSIQGSVIQVQQSNLSSTSGALKLHTSSGIQDPNSSGISVMDAVLKGRSMELLGNSVLSVHSTSQLLLLDHTATLRLSGSNVTVKGQVMTSRLNISSSQSICLAASLPGYAAKAGATRTEVDLTTQGTMQLGAGQNQWILSKLLASGKELVVMEGSSIKIQQESTCKNRGTAVADRCVDLRNGWGKSVGDWPPSADGDVTFGLVLLARDTLSISKNAYLQAASALLCGRQVSMDDQSTVDVSAGGCPAASDAATQPGGGKTMSGPTWGPLLAGGGTHVGRGGFAWWYDGTAANVDEETVPEHAEYDRYNETPWALPTRGASGGATGVPIGRESMLDPSDSAGGGLIWISGADGLSFGVGVRLNADGANGGVTAKGDFASAGGSGGQILVFSGPALTTTGAPSFSVRGGNGACVNHNKLWVVSGAGGGGFVGLNWTKPQPSMRPNLDIHADGGALNIDEKGSGCNLIPTKERLHMTHGMEGQQRSITPCPPGYANISCEECGLGTWSNHALGSCEPCKPIPPKGIFSKKAWATPDCPYTCSSGVPNKASNPDCKGPIDYALGFFGGWPGVLAIALGIAFAALLILWRRRSIKMGGRPLLEESVSSQTEVAESWIGRFCKKRKSNEFQISREKLPFHVCRVYFYGDNSSESPWLLSPSVPAMLEDLVNEQRWRHLAARLSKSAEVSKYAHHTEAWLGRLYPPLAPLLARHLRLRRARRVSLASGAQERLWTEIRAPGKELVVRFGCDRKATLAHLDFLDNARSPMDWAPVNLAKQAWVIPTHGQGTFAEPYEVDISDPVLQLLEHTDFGPTAVRCVMSTFNRAARQVSKSDLVQDEHNTLQQLHETLEQCASQCGLAGYVQASIISARRGRSDRSVQSPQRSQGSPQAEDGVVSQDSFMDLLEQGNDQTSVAPVRFKHQELRLCLVFTQFAALAGLTESPNDSGKALSLATPMPLQAWNDLLRCSASNIGAQSEAGRSRSLQRTLLRWGGGSDATARTLVSLTCLLGFDLMVFSLVFWILFKTSTAAGIVWFLLPPLSQPLALIFGLLFLILEDPELGKCFADLELFSMWNAAFALLVLLFSFLLDSFLFDILAMMVVVCVKALLFISAAAHVAQVEAGNDLSFIGAPQGDFVAGFFASPVTRSQVSSRPAGSQENLPSRPKSRDGSFHGFDVGARSSSAVIATSFPSLTRTSSRSAESPRPSSRIITQAPSPF